MRKSWLTFLLGTLLTVQGASADNAPAPSPEARCPVCGMFPANYPKWRAQATFRNGPAVEFDSPFDLFRFLGNMAKYDKQHTVADITQIMVTDYAKRTRIDARQAYYVSGSSIRGPMGPDLPAFANKADAEFLTRTSGGRVLNFDQAAREVGAAPR
jgi:nitrous oxide reductase accessory protein NosL